MPSYGSFHSNLSYAVSFKTARPKEFKTISAKRFGDALSYIERALSKTLVLVIVTLYKYKLYTADAVP